jgi:phenylacetate-CoA ligase
MFPPLHPSIVRNVIYPIYRGLRGDELLPMLEELERTQWLEPGEIEELQWRKLRGLLASAATFVPYYRDLFAGAGVDAGAVETIDDLRNIPFLTKERVREAGGSIITKDPLRRGLPAKMRGSAGEILYFFTDLSASPLKRANTLRGYRWTGIDIGERQAYLWGIDLDRPMKERLRDGFKNYFNNVLYLSTFDMSDETMRGYAAALRRFRPGILIGYPSALENFVRFCLRTGTVGPRPKAVVTSGEILVQQQRDQIEGFFSCSLFDRYGIREFGNVAHECETHEGLHLFSDLFYVEVLDDGGNPVGPGETGELVVTDLSNYYMPFVRYRTGDLAVQTDRTCSCGRGMPLLEQIEGQSINAILTTEGARSSLKPTGKSRFVVSNIEDRLVVKSKIHKAVITGEEPQTFDCLRVDEKLMELSNIVPGEKVLIVDNTNGARVETFAVGGLRGSGEVVAGGAVAKHIHSGDEVSIMAFAWSDGSSGEFKNILVDEHNNFLRYLTEVAGEML